MTPGTLQYSAKRMVVAHSTGLTLSKVRKKNVKAIGTTQLLRRPGKKKQRRDTSRTDNRKHKKQVMVDFNALPQLYAEIPLKSILKNVNGNGGGKCRKQRDVIVSLDPNPPTVVSDYAGKFGQSVHELGNAVVILCTKEKANFYEDKAHLTRHSASDSYKFTFSGNKNEYKKGSYRVFQKSKRVLLFVRMKKNISFTFCGEVRALSHNPYDHVTMTNPTWLFEFLDKNMPSSATSLLGQVFDKEPPKSTQP